jgi:hypothetical protein
LTEDNEFDLGFVKDFDCGSEIVCDWGYWDLDGLYDYNFELDYICYCNVDDLGYWSVPEDGLDGCILYVCVFGLLLFD